MNGQWRDSPIGNFQQESVERAGIRPSRISNATCLEKLGRISQRRKEGCLGKNIRLAHFEFYERLFDVICNYPHRNPSVTILHRELRMMVNTWKYPTSGERIHTGIRVAPRNENALLSLSLIVLPFHGDTMSGILAGNASKARKSLGANSLQSDEADASNCMIANQLRSESRGQYSADDIRRNPVVQ